MTVQKKQNLQDFLGELIGTFMLVFFGCGSVAAAVIFSAYSGLFQVAAIWGIGVTLAIYASRGLSCAHLNPAVSIAFCMAKRMSIKKLTVYLGAQFLGAFLAAGLLYILFSGSIAKFELINNIIRGTPDSIRTAMLFGEYFPNPAFNQPTVSHLNAFVAELAGTFLLVLLIFCLTQDCNVGRPDTGFSPVLIGLSVCSIISIIAPFTQAGLNPARDFGPRLFAYLAGWRLIAIPGPNGIGFFTVYILAPIIGGMLAAILFTKVLESLMKIKDKKSQVC